jgi:hypothetical protein
MLDHARELATTPQVGCEFSWIEDNDEHDHQDVYGLDTTSLSDWFPLSLSKRCPTAASRRTWIRQATFPQSGEPRVLEAARVQPAIYESALGDLHPLGVLPPAEHSGFKELLSRTCVRRKCYLLLHHGTNGLLAN